MRTFPLLAAALLFAMPVAHAQQAQGGEPGATEAVAIADSGTDPDVMDPEVMDPEVDAHAAAAADKPPSGFGQVMSVLTGLLQEAAQREATGRSDGFVLDNPAIEISVTPVEGRTSLLRAPAGKHEGRRGADTRQLAGGTPR